MRINGIISRHRDPLPADFRSIEEAAEYWDRHDLADYEDQTREVDFDVDLQRRTFLTALELQLAKKLIAAAERQGVSAETLINVWLTQKLAATTAGE